MADDLERLARKMYERMALNTIGIPPWEQLGTVTKGVWIERAEQKLAEQQPLAPKKRAKK